jgi:flagellar biosynthesis GTPase FlhF
MTTPEEQARIDAVAADRAEEDRKAEAKRIADRDRKRSERAVKKSKRDEASLLAQARRHAEAQAEDAERRKSERENLIISELTPPTDAESDTEYFQWFLGELDIFLFPFEQLKPFEKFFQHISASPAGRLVLKYFGVEPMDLTGCIADCEGIRPWSPLPAQTNPADSISPAVLSSELKIFYERQMQEKFAKTELEETERKRKHREHLRNLEKTYLAARKQMKETLLAKESA